MAAVALLEFGLLAGQVSAQADWYVDGAVSASGSGESWAEAFKTVQEAVDAAILLGGYDIWVAEGIYILAQPITIPSVGYPIPLKLLGGFDAGDTSLEQRDWVENVTVLDGNGAVSNVVYVTGFVDLIDGFTITGGTAASFGSGGGILIANCPPGPPYPVLRNLLIRNNGADSSAVTSLYYEGGGIYIQDCSPYIVNCTVTGNRVWGHGGGVFYRGVDPDFHGWPIIANSTFTGNHSDNNGGAVGVKQGNLTIVNSILWDDHAGDGVSHEVFGGTLHVSYTDIDQGSYPGIAGNIREDPQLVGVGRLHLREGSPAIDAGDNSSVPFFLPTDFDGDDRLVDGDGNGSAIVDMGADEFVPGALDWIWHVDAGIAVSGDGLSWATAFKTIHEAVAASGSDAEIWVKGGTHALTSSIVLTPTNRNLGIYGGFAGTETARSQRNWSTNVTTVDGQNSVQCFNIDWLSRPGAFAGVVIDGLTLTRCSRAVNIRRATGVRLINCSVASNSGGAVSTDSDLEVEGCLFSDNTGRALSSSAPLTVTDSIFIRNSVSSNYGDAGAILTTYGTIDRCSFFDNSAGRYGGAIEHSTGELVIRNSEFSGNRAGVDPGIAFGSGGAVRVDSGTVTIVNSTFSGNSADSAGAVSGLASNITVTNSILWGNSPTNISLPCGYGVVTYSIVDDTGFENETSCKEPYGNDRADPLFVDADGADDTIGTLDDDLSLSSSASPAVDTGDSTALLFGTLDRAGNPRFIDDPAVTDGGYGPPPAIDMGAYELQSSTPAETYDLTIAVVGSGSTLPAAGVHTYPAGSVVQVSATPAQGWAFVDWTGWVDDPSSLTTTVTMSWNRSLTANFKAVRSLSIDIQGTGSGRITSVPAGIDCPSDCEEVFDLDTPVTLSASMDAGTYFDGWSGGGCSGTGDCELVMSADAAVTALCNLEGGCGIGDAMTLENMTVDWTQLFEACTSITAGNGFVTTSPGNVTLRAGSSVVLTDGFSVGSGALFRADTYGGVGRRAIAMTKTAEPALVVAGTPITYTITVVNTGVVDLTEVSVTDPLCSAAPAYSSGDDGDSLLEAGETWVYACGGTAGAASFVNTASATFEDAILEKVSASASAQVTVTEQGCVDGDRYHDMGDGTILDCNTDLLWLRQARCWDLPDFGETTWENAIGGVADLAHGQCGLTDDSGAGDWRLPRMDELCGGWPAAGERGFVCDASTGLMNDAYEGPAVGNTAGDGQWTEGDPFIRVGSGYFVWSATERDESSVRVTYTYDGSATYSNKSNSNLVWPVRERE